MAREVQIIAISVSYLGCWGPNNSKLSGNGIEIVILINVNLGMDYWINRE